MRVYLKDLANMSRRERKKTLDEMVRRATAHRPRNRWLTRLIGAIR